MKKFNIALCLALVFTITMSFARFDALCQNVRDNVFRLHIRANSDSEDDQELKLKVRDAILNAEGECFKECVNLDEAINYAQNNIEEFKKIAEEVIKSNGYDYSVQISVGESYFENREYDDFTLPAGVYQSLNIIIGKGAGKNWWCVMFPSVCLGASSDLEAALNEDSTNIVREKDKYVIKFKSVEIYEDLKNYFKRQKIIK